MARMHCAPARSFSRITCFRAPRASPPFSCCSCRALPGSGASPFAYPHEVACQEPSTTSSPATSAPTPCADQPSSSRAPRIPAAKKRVVTGEPSGGCRGSQGRRIAAMDVYTQLEDKLVDMTRRLTQEAKCVPQTRVRCDPATR